MRYLIDRVRASAIHFTLSLAIAGLAAWLVFGLWYPFPYPEISGGRELFFLIVAVDVVAGPLITFIIFNRTKTRRHLTTDLSVVAMLQLAALTYGMWTAYMARPIHLVFEYHRLAVVHAIDIDPAQRQQAPVELQVLPLTGPTLLSLRPFISPEEHIRSTSLALGGIAQAAQPSLWQPYDAAKIDIFKATQPLAQLKTRFPAQAQAIDEAAAKTGLPPHGLGYLPVRGRKNDWTALIDLVTAKPVGFLPIDSF